MMKKIWIVFLICSAWLEAASFGNRVVVPILEIKENFIYTPAMDFKMGESGFVVHEFEKNRSIIVARVVIVDIQDNRAKMTFERYSSLDYDPFPRPKLKPQLSDNVAMRVFYDRAFLIAPNQELYLNFSSRYTDIQWFHPDLFAAYLINEGRSAPRLKDFKSICEAYAVGIVYIVQKEYTQARDCQSFALIKQDELDSSDLWGDDPVLPFFSRFGAIKRGWLGAVTGDKKIKDYEIYYKDLINEATRQNLK